MRDYSRQLAYAEPWDSGAMIHLVAEGRPGDFWQCSKVLLWDGVLYIEDPTRRWQYLCLFLKGMQDDLDIAILGPAYWAIKQILAQEK